MALKYSNRLTMIGVVLVFFFNLIIGTSVVEAAGEESADYAGATGFSYQINFPDNQIEKDLGYFKLNLAPNTKQTLEIVLTNPTDEKVVVGVEINGAKTNQNGVVEYGTSAIKNDKSLAFPFEKLATGPDEVVLEPKTSKTLEVKVAMPETSFEGSIAGGIQLMRTNQKEETGKSGSQIINEYAYVIPVLLQEKDNTLEPKLEFNSVKAGQSNYRNTIYVNFSNVVATYVREMTVEVQLKKKENKAVLFERKQTMMTMAPNTFLDFPVSMNGEAMESGDYVANILVKSGEKKWEWEEPFKITDKEADKFNERDVGLVSEKGIDTKLIVMIIVGVIALVAVVFGLISFVRKKKQNNKRKTKTSAKNVNKKRGTKAKTSPRTNKSTKTKK